MLQFPPKVFPRLVATYRSAFTRRMDDGQTGLARQ